MLVSLVNIHGEKTREIFTYRHWLAMFDIDNHDRIRLVPLENFGAIQFPMVNDTPALLLRLSWYKRGKKVKRGCIFLNSELF